MYRKIISVAVVLIVALILTVNSKKDYRDLKQQLKASLITYDSSKELMSFSLVDHNNSQFNNDRLKNKWTLLMFVYTHCPDVCPTELLNMSLLRAVLLGNQSESIPEVVSITFDPIRDTPEVLKAYISHFNEDFLGVSGEQSSINKLVKSFGAYYEKSFKDENGKEVILHADEPLPKYAIENGYVINHTAQIYLISPDGQIFAEFPTPHNVKTMASDINLIIKNYQ